MKRLRIFPVIGFVAATGHGCDQATNEGDNSKPNVILILADDMAYGDLSMNNGGLTRTPHLDQLAEAGVVFSQGYSASPVCATARTAPLIGLLRGEHGMRLFVKDTGNGTVGYRCIRIMQRSGKDNGNWSGPL